ncbi:MAG: T9SS type A sorting domain-containing protein [Saprospiraceae bacterium]
MKKLVLSIAVLCCGLTSQAQITVTNAMFPEVGDTLYTAIDNMPSGIAITSPGGPQSWNFASLQSPFTRQNVVRAASTGSAAGLFPAADVLLSLGNNGEGYFNVTSTRFELVGISGTDPIGQGVQVQTRYNPAEVYRRAPMNVFDVNQTQSALLVAFSADDLPSVILDLLPITPDSLRIRLSNNRVDIVDAWGTLTIPGGIYDVLREKRTQYRDVRLDIKVGFFPWQDITDIVLQLAGVEGIAELGKDTTVTYNFFSNEAKEPIAVVTMNATETAPEMVEYKAKEIVSNVQNTSGLKPSVYAFPNPAIVSVRFEFSNLPKGEYTLRIFNVLGEEVMKKRYHVNGSRTEKVDISQLRKGAYLYSLVNDRGKTLATKRLVVVRP